MRTSTVFLLALLLANNAQFFGEPIPTRDEIVGNAVKHDERIWREISGADIPGTLGSHDLFAYALALCESKTHPDRLEKLFEVAAKMQCRDEKKPGFGNFRWSWKDADVFDLNAVDFCMQCAAPLWIRHHEALPTGAREKLRELIEFGVRGLMRHNVRASYTNIALMNAGNLILLGEALRKPDVADEGYLRLDAACLDIWENGVHEYVSPSYYGIDLYDLTLIDAFCQRERGRAQARALLELFWTDIALNWFPPAEKLAGTHSRDYDYLHGLGILDQQLMLNGWLHQTEKQKANAIQSALAQWRPPQRLKELSERQFPREVRQGWGPEPDQTRTHFLHHDITLSTSGQSYGGRMDLPLTVDLPGARESVRCYFIPDGRHDPYGKIKITETPAHSKTLHLNPFFAGAQRGNDALGLVVYRDKDLPENTETLESHFVMPLDTDGFWINDRRVDFTKGKTSEFPLKNGDAVVLRKGTAAVGVRVVWSRDSDGREAPASLVYDANSFGAVRLTVAHRAGEKSGAASANPGAAFWVRIGSEFKNDAGFEKWRSDFLAAKADVISSPERVRVRLGAQDGAVIIEAAAPFEKTSAIEPKPQRAVLALDGEDVGRRILQDIEPMKTQRQFSESPAINVAPDRGTFVEAEAGCVVARMVVGEDKLASGARFVWMPAQPGEEAGHGGPGSVTWRLKIAKAEEYFIWGRVLAPTPKSDSFFVRLSKDNADIIPNTVWPTGTHKSWEWTRMAIGKAPPALQLPEGELRLQISAREHGTKIDRLFITPKASEKPE